MVTGFVIGDRGLGSSGDTHPPWMMAHAVTDNYLIVGASAVGQIHLARGLPRDDGFVIRSIGPWLAVAVADGVGSRPLSRYGATYAVESLTSMLLRPFASLKEAAHPESGPEPLASDLASVAPPPKVDIVELKPLLIRKGSGLGTLATGLTHWTKKRFAVGEPLPPKEISPGAFQQRASIGWWHLPSVAPSSDAIPLPSQAPVPAIDRGRIAGRQQPLADKPNLVAIMRQAFEKTHLGLREHARSLDMELADLSCTALALLLNVETGRGAAGQVGDGAILGLTARGKVKELIEPEDTGDPQSVYTLNRPNFEQYLVISVVEPPPANPYVAFYVMTDGLSGDLLYSPKPEALEDWAQQVDRNVHLSTSPAQAAAGMLNWLATYEVKGSWDDRTLVVITQREREHGNRQPAVEQSESAQSTDNQ